MIRNFKLLIYPVSLGTMFTTYKQQFADIIATHVSSLSREDIFSLIETPPSNIPGDLAFPCFALSKTLKQSPHHIALHLAEQCQESQAENSIFVEYKAAGPYLNTHIATNHLASSLIPTITEKADDYGRGGDKKQTILIEGRSPNTHKVLHVGHLRNILVSQTICDVYSFAGYKVIKAAYGGDIGAHVAKRIRYYTHFYHQELPTDPEKFTIVSGEIYALATKKVAENPEKYKAEVHETQRLLESGDTTLQTIRQETRTLSIAGLTKAFAELGSTHFDRFYRESEVEQPGIKLIQQLVQDNTIQEIKHSQGAIIADLESYNLGVFLLLKSNGTSLYSTKDIALALLKQKEYSFDQSLYVVATEQNHHFQQLFKTLEIIGHDTSKLHHMGYELVELPDGKMSSRKGTIIPYHTRRDNAIQQARQLIEERDIDNKEKVAKEVAFAALKFSILLQDTYKKIRLDINKALSFEGETGPYLQYTYARISSLLNKTTEKQKTSSETNQLSTIGASEHPLLISLSQFPDIIQQSVDDRKPSILARYVLELCRTFNSYYSTTTILTDNSIETQSRLLLVQATQQVLKNGLKLLGLSILEKM